MRKEEFLRELEYLLQDIAEEDKRDAIDYYRDYLEEAGPEQEMAVLAEFGSPERIASIIRTDLLGGMEEAGEFTERGYSDSRFDSSADLVVREGNVNDDSQRGESGSRMENETGGATYSRTNSETKNTYYDRAHDRKAGNPFEKFKEWCSESFHFDKASYKSSGDTEEYTVKKTAWWLYVLIGLFILIAAPMVLSAALGAVGGTIGIILALVGMFLVLAVGTLGALLGGVVMVAVGIFQLFGSFWAGLLFIGVGIAAVGVGLLLLGACYLFYGKFIPWLVRAFVKLVKRIAGAVTGCAA